MDLKGKKIAIFATNGFEQSELEVPRDYLSKAGATVDVVSLASGEIKGRDKKDWPAPKQTEACNFGLFRIVALFYKENFQRGA